MRIFKWLVAGALALLSTLVPLRAEVLLYQFQGTVGSLSDGAGVFGSPAAGSSFELVYRGDFSLGLHSGGGGGGGSTNFLTGGSSVPPEPAWPTIHISPISAVLTINGHQLEFSGEYLGNVQYTDNVLGEILGSGPAYSWADFTAQAGLRQDGSLLNQITSRLDSPQSATTFGSVDAPMVLAIDGVAVTGAASFSYVWAAGTPQETLISGSLLPLSYVVAAAAVPEPAPWLMLLVGALAGVPVLRRRGTRQL